MWTNDCNILWKSYSYSHILSLLSFVVPFFVLRVIASNREQGYISLHLVSYTQCCSELRQQWFPFIHFYFFFHPSSLILFRALCFFCSCSDLVFLLVVGASVPLHIVSHPLLLSFFFNLFFLSFPFNVFTLPLSQLSNIYLCFASVALESIQQAWLKQELWNFENINTWHIDHATKKDHLTQFWLTD